jgi:transposase
MAMSIVETRLVVGGVDTHADVHVAAALDGVGGLLGVESFPTTPAGHGELHGWLCRFGIVSRVGVEGTGAYGAGLARHLARAGVTVIEVDRPNRQARRRHGKSDPIDAIEAARAVLSGRASGIAKSGDGNVEAIRALLVALRSGRETRIRCLTQLRHLVFRGPDDLREQFRDLRPSTLLTRIETMGGDCDDDPVTTATKHSMRVLARRVIDTDIANETLVEQISELVNTTAPSLAAVFGVGPYTAALLLVAAGDNPDRIRSEAAFAHLCGVAPIHASSGKVTRHRLNRGGNRQANHALWRIVFTRMRRDERTRSYVERRVAEGKSKLEIIRILKRYVAREVYPHLIG